MATFSSSRTDSIETASSDKEEIKFNSSGFVVIAVGVVVATVVVVVIVAAVAVFRFDTKTVLLDQVLFTQ